MKKIYILLAVTAVCAFALASPNSDKSRDLRYDKNIEKKEQRKIAVSSIARLDSLEPTVRQLEKNVYNLKNAIGKLQKRVYTLEKYLAPQKGSSPKISRTPKNYKNLFPYHNVKFKKDPDSNYIRVIGEITNNSGKRHDMAIFTISVYDSHNRLMDIDTIIIGSFEQGQTKSFDALFEPLAYPIHHYKIDFDG